MYALQDAFRAMHLDLGMVKLYLKPLLIGELSPEEPSQEKNKNVSTASGSKNVEGLGIRLLPKNTVFWENEY
jgi:hypothetical protein